MKITRNQLRKIIQESTRLLTEDSFTRTATTDEQEAALRKLKSWLPKLGFAHFSSAPMPETYSPTIVLVDLTYHGSEIYVHQDGDITIRGRGDPVYSISDLRTELEAAGISSSPKHRSIK